MGRIIQRAKRHEETTYERVFSYRRNQYDGYRFPCDAHGVVAESKLTAAALENLKKCLGREIPVVDEGVQEIKRRWREPALLRCDCGETLELRGFTNTCGNCCADYNSAGQRLADREQWGEESGETANDILMAEAAGFPEMEG